MRADFHPAASDEVLASAVFYENQVPELGERFVLEVERVVALICEQPRLGQQIHEGLRSIVLAKFPYSLIYATDVDRVLVLAVAHQRRRPGYWRERMNR